MRPDLTVQAWYRSYTRIEPEAAEEAVAERLGVDADRVAVVDVRVDVETRTTLSRVAGFSPVWEYICEVAV